LLSDLFLIPPMIRWLDKEEDSKKTEAAILQ